MSPGEGCRQNVGSPFLMGSFHLTADFGLVFLTEQEAPLHKSFYVILTVYFI